MFSSSLHLQRIDRAKARFANGNDFLLQRAVEDMVERLSAVNLEFNDAVLLFGRADAVADQLRDSKKISNIKRVEEPAHLGNADHIARPDLLERVLLRPRHPPPLEHPHHRQRILGLQVQERHTRRGRHRGEEIVMGGCAIEKITLLSPRTPHP